MSPQDFLAGIASPETSLRWAEEAAYSLLLEKAGEWSDWLLAARQEREGTPVGLYEWWLERHDAGDIKSIADFIKDVRRMRAASADGDYERAFSFAVPWLVQPRDWWKPGTPHQKKGGRKSSRDVVIYLFVLLELAASEERIRPGELWDRINSEEQRFRINTLRLGEFDEDWGRFAGFNELRNGDTYLLMGDTRKGTPVIYRQRLSSGGDDEGPLSGGLTRPSFERYFDEARKILQKAHQRNGEWPHPQ